MGDANGFVGWVPRTLYGIDPSVQATGLAINHRIEPIRRESLPRRRGRALDLGALSSSLAVPEGSLTGLDPGLPASHFSRERGPLETPTVHLVIRRWSA